MTVPPPTPDDPRAELLRGGWFTAPEKERFMAALDSLAADLAQAERERDRRRDEQETLSREYGESLDALEAAREALAEIRDSPYGQTTQVGDMARRALAAGSVAPPDGDAA